MVLSVINEHIRSHVIHLYSLIVAHVEDLGCLIGRESTIAASWMPVGIDHRAPQSIIAGLQYLITSSCVNHRSAMWTSDVEHVLFWIRAVLCMTVHAIAMNL